MFGVASQAIHVIVVIYFGFFILIYNYVLNWIADNGLVMMMVAVEVTRVFKLFNMEQLNASRWGGRLRFFRARRARERGLSWISFLAKPADGHGENMAHEPVGTVIYPVESFRHGDQGLCSLILLTGLFASKSPFFLNVHLRAHTDQFLNPNKSHWLPEQAVLLGDPRQAD